MKKIVLLSTDTAHHRYFINELKRAGHSFEEVLFETTSVKAPFETGPFLAEEEKAFEATHFFKEVSSDISSESITEFENINQDDAVAHLKQLNPDLGIVFGTRKLSKSVIECFKDGLFNIHRGIPQRYRGIDSEYWSIYHGDLAGIGATLHQVDLKLDTGHIVYQESAPLGKDTRLFQLRYLTSVVATQLTIKALNDYTNDKVRLTPQKEQGRYYSFMPLCIKQTLAKKFERLLHE